VIYFLISLVRSQQPSHVTLKCQTCQETHMVGWPVHLQQECAFPKQWQSQRAEDNKGDTAPLLFENIPISALATTITVKRHYILGFADIPFSSWYTTQPHYLVVLLSISKYYLDWRFAAHPALTSRSRRDSIGERNLIRQSCWIDPSWHIYHFSMR
jgi:hypothetical protein